MVWDILEALAIVTVVGGLFLLFGAWALVGGGAAVLAASWLLHRGGGAK